VEYLILLCYTVLDMSKGKTVLSPVYDWNEILYCISYVFYSTSEFPQLM